MSFWGQKVTDTAKLSVEVRYIQLNRALKSLGNLKRLRARALRQTSTPTTVGFAGWIPLPEQDGEERIALRESSSGTDFPWPMEGAGPA